MIMPIKDFLIALLFSYLYYKQGKKQQLNFNEILLKGSDDAFLHMEKFPSILSTDPNSKFNRLKTKL